MLTKELLRQIVTQQKNTVRLPEGTVKREILDSIMGSLNDSRVLIITGIRRSGKSTLLKQMIQNVKDYCYVNFEDERFIDFKAQDFESLNEVLIEIYNNPKIYFFDEIQNIDKFELFVRRLQDQDKKVVITGSNSALLSRELGTRLTGRYKSFEVYPFSFKEFLSFNGTAYSRDDFYLAEKKVKLLKLFNDYFNLGGMPEYLKNKDIEYIRTVYENIIYKDVIARYSIKKQKIVRELVNILLANISSLFTYNSIKKPLGLSNSITVKEYISYLCNSYLFFELQKFDFSMKRQLTAPKKSYVIDNAFSRIMGFNFSENKGRLLENMVFIELKRRGKEIYYYSNNSECDFVIKTLNKISSAIQVCYSLTKENREREISSLLEAMQKFKLKVGYILTYEQEEEIRKDKKTIKVLPVLKWLLQDKAF